ncbi:hypothetical protein CVM73_32550 [Bradyrhizobium forestalis]|uniref:Uncharacterized protein n=1 Tax=Bradyrhizobium forestalis TaxID=1419263 RepID=A0A2M8QZZ5_9BRAD|nr:hypothetical protein CVM73_32550 [Bradyrhizobium forestalis]
MNVCRMGRVNVQTLLFPLMVRSALLRASRTMQARLSIPGLTLRDARCAGSSQVRDKVMLSREILRCAIAHHSSMLRIAPG